VREPLQQQRNASFSPNDPQVYWQLEGDGLAAGLPPLEREHLLAVLGSTRPRLASSRLSVMMPVTPLEQQIDNLMGFLQAGQETELAVLSQAFLAEVNLLASITYPYLLAEKLAPLITDSRFNQLQAPTRTYLLQGLTACLQQGLLRGLVDTKGLGQLLQSDFIHQIRYNLPRVQTDKNAALALTAEVLVVVLKLVKLLQADNRDAIALLETYRDLVNKPLNQLIIEGLNHVGIQLTRLADVMSVQEGLLWLLASLAQWSYIEEIAVIRWVQEQVRQLLPGSNSQNDWPLETMTIQFLLARCAKASLLICDELVVNSHKTIGLHYWLESKQPVDWRIRTLLAEGFTSVAEQRKDTFLTALQAACSKIPLEGSLVTILLRLIRQESTTAPERLRYCLLYQHVQQLEGVKLEWQDYQILGDASCILEPELAKRAYLRAQQFIQKSPVQGSEEQQASTYLKNQLCKLYTTQGQQLLQAGKKVEGLRFLLAALTLDIEQKENSTLSQEALSVLFTASLPSLQSELSNRLEKVTRPLAHNETKESALRSEHIVITSIFSGIRVLESSCANQLFDGKTLRVSNTRQQGDSIIQEGRHRVAVIGEAPYQLHIKENPASPGLAFAAWSLYQLMYGLTGSAQAGLIPVEPLKIERYYQNKLHTYYTQASPTVYGDNLRDVFVREPDVALPYILTTLANQQVSALIIVSMLLDPEDGRAANFLVQANASGERYLVSVDNDHVWVNDAMSEASILYNSRLVIKTIIYCFPQMQEAIDSTLKAQLASDAFAPVEMMKLWLYSLQYYNQQVSTVYTPDEQKALFECPGADDKVILEAYFNAEQLGRLYLKWVLLRRALRDNTMKTHLDLLTVVQFRLRTIYHQAWKASPISSPYQRFEQLTRGLFTVSGGTKTTNTQLTQLVLGKAIKTYPELQANRLLPQQLLRLLKEIHHEGHLVRYALNDLQQGNLALFSALKDLQEVVLHQLSFSQIKERYTPPFHQRFLATISEEITELTLQDNPQITDIELIQLLQRLPKLTTLKLSGCQKIQGELVGVGLDVLGVFNKQSVVSVCAQKGISTLHIQHCENLQPIILEELHRHYGTRITAQVQLEGNNNCEATQVQPFAVRYPQWGLALQTLDASLVPTLSTMPQGHTNSVRALAILPDGRVVSGSDDNTLKLWDMVTKQCIATLPGHTGIVRALAVLPDGRVVSGSDDNTLKLWDIATKQCVATLQGHTNIVSALAVLPDERVVSGSWGNNTLKLWDIATKQCVATLEGHTDFVWALAILPDGRVVSGSDDNTLKLWDMVTKQCIVTLQGHTGIVRALAVLPDGRVVSGSSDNTLKLWDMVTKQCVATLQEHTGIVRALTVLPDGRVVSGSSDKTLKFWDIATKQCVATLQGHTNTIAALAVLPDGRVVSGSGDDTLKLWSAGYAPISALLPTHAARLLHSFRHSNTVAALAVLSDRRVVSSSGDNTLKLWSAGYAPVSVPLLTHAARLLHNFTHLLASGYLQEQHIPLLLSSTLTSLTLAHTRVNDRLLRAILTHCSQLKTADIRGCVWLTDASITTLMQHPSLTEVVMADNPYISGNGKDRWHFFLSTLNDTATTLTITDNFLLTDSDLIFILERLPPALRALTLTNCPQLRGEPIDLSVGLSTRTISSFVAVCAKLGIRQLQMTHCDNLQLVILQELHQHYGARADVRIQLEGNKNLDENQVQPFAACYPHWGTALQALDASLAPILSATLQGHTGIVTALAVLPDGRVVSGSWDKTLKLWGMTTKQCVATLQGHTNTVTVLAVLPDGRVISGSNTLKLWDIATKQCIATLQGHTNTVRALAVLSDGRVVSGSWDNTLKLWDMATKQCVATLQGHTNIVSALTVLPDGRVVSGSWDNTLKLWDIATKQCVATLQGHTGAVRALVVLLDGRVVSGSGDNTLKLWDIATEQCVATLQGHTNIVTALAVLPDGRVVSGSDDNTLKLWDMVTKQCAATLQGHTSTVRALAVLPDGRVVSGSEDHTLKIWSAGYAPVSAPLLTHAARLLHNFTHLLTFGYLYEQHIPLLLNPELNSLTLAHTRVNDRLLRAILTHGSQLKTVDISNCAWLTDASIVALMQHPSLTEVVIAENPSITTSSKEKLLAHLQQKSAGSSMGAPLVHYSNTLTTSVQDPTPNATNTIAQEAESFLASTLAITSSSNFLQLTKNETFPQNRERELVDTAEEEKAYVVQSHQSTSSEKAANLTAFSIKDSMQAVQTINTIDGLGFNRHLVTGDGDCGYTAFGITREQAFELVRSRLSEVGEVLEPVIQEQLLMQDFIDYLEQHQQANTALVGAFEKYQRAAQLGEEIDEIIMQRLQRHASDLVIINGYVNYDIRDKRIDTGWSHPCVLQVLAHLQKIEFYIWQKNSEGQLVPHEYYPHYKSPNAPPNIGRTDLLFINGNHFERLELVQPENTLQDITVNSSTSALIVHGYHSLVPHEDFPHYKSPNLSSDTAGTDLLFINSNHFERLDIIQSEEILALKKSPGRRTESKISLASSTSDNKKAEAREKLFKNNKDKPIRAQLSLKTAQEAEPFLVSTPGITLSSNFLQLAKNETFPQNRERELVDTAEEEKAYVVQSHQSTGSEKAANLAAFSIKDSMQAVQTINTIDGLGFNRHLVTGDGDCGYTALGITREQAFELVRSRLSEVGEVLEPVIQEQLLMQDFIDYLEQHQQANTALVGAFEKYQRAAQLGEEIDEIIMQRLQRHASDLVIINGYVNYDIRDKRIDTGWSHPCVLQVLAHLQKIEFYIWQENSEGQLVPHEYYPHYKSPNAPPNIGRTDLLFINGNHFERLELVQPENTLQDIIVSSSTSAPIVHGYSSNETPERNRTRSAGWRDNASSTTLPRRTRSFSGDNS